MNNLGFFIGLACLFWFFSRLWPALMVDWGRQSLFEVRDNIFLLAASDDFDSFGFNNELYQTIRTELNSMIRYLEDINGGADHRIWAFSEQNPYICRNATGD